MFISLIKIMIPLAKQIPGVSVIATSIETALATAQGLKSHVMEKGAATVRQGLGVAGQVGKLASSLPTAAAGAAGAAAAAAAASAPVFLALPRPSAPHMPYHPSALPQPNAPHAPPYTAHPPILYNNSMLDKDFFNIIQEQYKQCIILQTLGIFPRLCRKVYNVGVILKYRSEALQLEINILVRISLCSVMLEKDY
jgi:hypothetical protein